jgi:hypothetical protein
MLGEEAAEAKEIEQIRDTVIDEPMAFAVMNAQRRVAAFWERTVATRQEAEEAITDLLAIQKEYPESIAAKEAEMALGIFRRWAKSLASAGK